MMVTIIITTMIVIITILSSIREPKNYQQQKADKHVSIKHLLETFKLY